MPELVNSVLDVFPIDCGMPKPLATSLWENIHHVIENYPRPIFLNLVESTVKQWEWAGFPIYGCGFAKSRIPNPNHWGFHSILF